MTSLRIALRLVPTLVLATACGKGDDTGGDGTTGDATTGDTGMTTAGMTMTSQASVDDTTGGSMTMGQTGDETDAGESSSGGPAGVLLGGEVADFNPLSNVPIPDAAISVWTMPGFETTSDARGLWSAGPFAPNQDIVFVVDPSTEYLGSVIPVRVGESDNDNVDLAQLSLQFVMDQYGLIMDMGAIEPDLDASIMVVRLINTQALGEGPVDVMMTPAPVEGTYYAPTDPAGVPELNSNQMQFMFLPVVVFYNLPDSQPGDITFEFSHPMRECTTVFNEYPTFGGHITLVDVECPPP